MTGPEGSVHSRPETARGPHAAEPLLPHPRVRRWGSSARGAQCLRGGQTFTSISLRTAVPGRPDRHLHTAHLLDLSDDLPISVEIVDTSEAIRRFVPLLDPVIPHGTATLSPVHIVKYSTGHRT